METFVIGAGLLVLGIAIGAILMVLFGRLQGMDRRLNALEECQKKRLPYNTAAGVEDALAVNLDMVRAANELEIEAQALRMRAGQQESILKLVRQGPESYPIDRPAGLRPNEKNSVNQK